MGKKSMLKVPGYAERLENIKNNAIKIVNDHLQTNYPKIEEDGEGIATWESPKRVKMQFKNITPVEGYLKTMTKFKRLHMDKYIRCYLENGLVVIEF